MVEFLPRIRRHEHSLGIKDTAHALKEHNNYCIWNSKTGHDHRSCGS